MIRLDISSEDLEAISEALDDPSIKEQSKRKLLALRMHSLGMEHSKIAGSLNLSDDTITNYIKAYRDEGLAGILENRYYQPTSKVDPYLQEIGKSLGEQPVATANEASDRIYALCGIRLSASQARRIMKKLGLQYRKTGSIPGKADPQLQLDFFVDELLPRLEEAREGKRRVFFVDAVHFVLGAFLGMVWCYARIFIPSGSGRQRYNVLGAVETRDHDLVTIRTTGPINAGTVCELIEEIDRRYPGEAITLVMDNARYQFNRRVQELAETTRIELLYLPPYSPNLNLIERVWKLVKSKCLRNRYFEHFANFRESIDEFLDDLNREKRHLLKTLLTENFQFFNNPRT